MKLLRFVRIFRGEQIMAEMCVIFLGFALNGLRSCFSVEFVLLEFSFSINFNTIFNFKNKCGKIHSLQES